MDDLKQVSWTFAMITESILLMRSRGHQGQLVVVLGEGVDVLGTQEFNGVLLRQHVDLAAPNTFQVVTQETYQELIGKHG